jgi:predicted peptidase
MLPPRVRDVPVFRGLIRLRRRLRRALQPITRRLGALLVVLAPACRTSEPPLPAGAHELAARMLGAKFSRAGAPYDIPYRLFVPAGSAEGRRYPMIVFLHASGQNGTDNLRQLTPSIGVLIGHAQSIEPAFVLVPQAPESDKWVSGSVGPPFRIDPDRIYLTGVSAGGAGTWDLITRNGVGRFAAAVPITGANDPSRASVIARLPIWAFHGAADEISPVENVREMVANLRALGSPVRYTEYPGVGHDSARPAYAEPELFPWLFGQRRNAPAVHVP